MLAAIASGCFDADVYKQSHSVGTPFVVQCTSKESLTSHCCYPHPEWPTGSASKSLSFRFTATRRRRPGLSHCSADVGGAVPASAAAPPLAAAAFPASAAAPLLCGAAVPAPAAAPPLAPAAAHGGTPSCCDSAVRWLTVRWQMSCAV